MTKHINKNIIVNIRRHIELLLRKSIKNDNIYKTNTLYNILNTIKSYSNYQIIVGGANSHNKFSKHINIDLSYNVIKIFENDDILFLIYNDNKYHIMKLHIINLEKMLYNNQLKSISKTIKMLEIIKKERDKDRIDTLNQINK